MIDFCFPIKFSCIYLYSPDMELHVHKLKLFLNRQSTALRFETFFAVVLTCRTLFSLLLYTDFSQSYSIFQFLLSPFLY